MTELLYPITDRSAELGGPDNCYRWSLTREWMYGDGTAFWLCNNPSDADAEIDDPTALRICAFSQRWGYRRAVVGNWSPLRTSSPAENLAWCRGLTVAQYADLARNSLHVQLLAYEADIRIMAFGNADHPVLNKLVGDLSRIVGPLHCIGTTANGSPKHPLARGLHRVPIDTQPVPWDTSMRKVA